MARILFLVILILFLLSSLGADKLSVAQFEQRILELTNAERARFGLKPLVYESGLAALAKHHSNNMAKYGFFDHTDQEKLDVSRRREKYYPELLASSIGENLAYNEIPSRKFSPADIVTGWMNSPGHRENILTPEYTHLGVGVVLKGSKLYSTQNFGTAIVKLKSALPKTLKRNKRYVLEFEYLSPQARQGFKASLKLPDPTKIVNITERTYVRGYVPLESGWKSATEFSVTVDLTHGKGEYVLNFGWDGLFFERCFVFKVK
ncbi:MAG: CAP domain-containing protein [Candidatus Cloacimonadaceae bacterium]|nr:CAP domain-containing protein [Candidatus Cloacimonadaceae bacterium]